ncbi:hypothetical protein J7M07_01830 [bacterium]|nr:hypothetical protein [bacterium]
MNKSLRISLLGYELMLNRKKTGNITLHWQKGEGNYNRKEITTGVKMIDKWKVISSRSGHEHAGDPDKGGK